MYRDDRADDERARKWVTTFEMLQMNRGRAQCKKARRKKDTYAMIAKTMLDGGQGHDQEHELCTMVIMSG